MHPDPADQLISLFAELTQLTAPERVARLETIASGHPDQAAELRGLLRSAEAAGDFLAVLDARVRPGAAGAGAAFTPGDRLGPYRLMRPLGSGGMGMVWLAEDERLEREVAIKLFAPDPAARGTEGGGRRRMLAEARAVAQLDHPHVATVYDVGELPDGTAYLAMMYCRGGSLAERLTDAPLGVEQTVRVGRQLAGALAAAHRLGIVHRDVKPGNILFDTAGQARLADFGIALGPAAAPDSPGNPAGTLAYLPPEVLAGGPAEPRSDLWALGVTLYRMLAGRMPFDGHARATLIYQITREPPAPLADRSELPPAVGSLIGSLLAKDPAGRPGSAEEVERLLDRISLPAYGRVSPIPNQLTPLVGRDDLLERATAQLTRARLLTLTGPAGVGKTRLALEIVRRGAEHHLDGACLVRLAEVTRSELVPSAVAAALGLEERGAGTPAQMVLRACAGSDRILLLDNCEHLPEATAFIESLLLGSPRLTVVATGRAPLQIVGEQELPVSPLALPGEEAASDAVLASPAVRLFLERARARDPEFTPAPDTIPDLIAICRRLDGLPLALELAAARVRPLGLARLRARLDVSTGWLGAGAHSRPERHRTLQAAIEWSYSLLPPDTQILFLMLSVFVGGFRDTAAAAALGTGSEPAGERDPLELLAALVDSSLVVVSEQGGAPRFGMLGTLRSDALERLRAAGLEHTARRRHADYHVALAEAAAEGLRGPGQTEWHQRLRDEQANLHAALGFLVSSGDLPSAARLAVALYRHWLVSVAFLNDTVEQLTRLEHAIAEAGDDRLDPHLRAELLMVLGSLAGMRGDHCSALHRWFEAGLGFYRRAGDSAGEARALNNLGWNARHLGRHAEAAAHSSAALELNRRDGAAAGTATSLINLGWVALDEARLDLADERFAEALAIQQRLGDRRSIGYAMGHLGTAAIMRGDLERGIGLYRQAAECLRPLDDRVAGPTFEVRRLLAEHMALSGDGSLEQLESELLPALRRTGYAWSLGYALAAAARLRLDAGRIEDARESAEESLAVRRTAGFRSEAAESEMILARVALAAGDPADAAARLAGALQDRRKTGEPLSLVECSELAAALADRRNDSAAVLTLLTGAGAARARLGAARWPRTRVELAELEQRAEAALEADQAGAARDRGAAMTLDELVEFALGSLAP